MSESKTNNNGATSVAVGALLAFCGFLLILIPVLTTIKIAFLLGWVMFAAGMLAIAKAFPGGKKEILEMITGGLTAIAGLYLALNPSIALKSLVLLIVIIALVRGFAGIFAAIRSSKDRALTLIIAAIDLAIAFILLRLDLASASRLVGIYIALTIILWGISIVVSARPKDEAAPA